ncbi:MAG: energy transducer TonB [Polymorphobacter sp.]
MAYADEGMSKNRMVALGIVALLHVFLGYAFITGLALKAVKAIVNPLETVNVKEEAPPPDEPPPPPPKDIEIPPFVPPPEVSVQSEAAPTITVQQQVQQVAPPVFTPPAPPAPPAPALKAPTPATAKGRGNVISEDDYPDASRRAEDQGSVRISYTVDATGKVSACEVTKSSGFPRLDDATCKIVIRRWRFNPATRDGQPVAENRSQSVKWQLTDAR